MTEPFGLYIHVPFCATRCGYCDFNTYTPGELGSPRDLTGPYLDALDRELELAAARVGRPAETDLDLLGELKMPIKALNATL